MNRTQRILSILLDDITGFFPYFFGFYLFSLLSSLLFHSWKLFFNWKLFTLSIVILGIASLFSRRVRPLFTSISLKWKEKALIHDVVSYVKNIDLSNVKNILFTFKNTLFATVRLVIRSVKWIFYRAVSVIKFLVGISVKWWKRLGRRDQIKVGIIVAILIFALIKSIGIIDFIVLTYAIASILFIFESRISAVLALVLLASCPFFLMFKKDDIAEVMAIYAYYFLVITVFTQIAEYMKENKSKGLSTGV